jgi:hypothetical protein
MKQWNFDDNPHHTTAGKMFTPETGPQYVINNFLFMKRCPAISIKSSTVLSQEDKFESLVPPVMADSLEVVEYYYREKIQVLETSLKQLTLLDNAREITFLCREINDTKTALNVLLQKRKYMIKLK